MGEQSTNVTRNAWVAAGLPQSVPATTVDRQCGSSQQAMHFGAAGVKAGHYDLVVACGVESMSRVPLASNARGGTGPFPPSFLEVIDGRLWAQFRVAQVLADRWDVSREEMDEYSLESHRRAAATWDAGGFAAEAVPVPIKDEEGAFTGDSLTEDEGIRRSGSMESMAGLPPAQNWEPETAPDITAGNSSQMTDGASAMLIAERSLAERLGLPIRGRFAHATVAADDAAIVLSAPVPATERLLERSGMKVDQFDASSATRPSPPFPSCGTGPSTPIPSCSIRVAGPSPSGTPWGRAVCGWQPPCSTGWRPPAVATASRPCVRVVARPTPWSSNAWPNYLG